MDIKYGIKVILRTPLKTALFALLIALVSGFLSLGAGMFRSAEAMLEEADAQFLTAGEFTFVGGDYPTTAANDEALYDARRQFNIDDYKLPGALVAEEHITRRVYVPDYIPIESRMPYRRYAIVVVAALTTDDMFYFRGQIDSTVREVFFSERDDVAEGYQVMLDWSIEEALDWRGERLWTLPSTGYEHLGQNIYLDFDKDGLLDPANDWGVEITSGRQYVVFGELYTNPGWRGYSLQTKPFIGDFNAPPEYGAYSPIIDVTGRDFAEFWRSDAGLYLSQAAESVHIRNMSMNLVASEDIRAVSAFHRGLHTLTEGAFPDVGGGLGDTGASPDGAPSGNGGLPGCVIPVRVAAQLSLSVGDSITLSIHEPVVEANPAASYWVGDGFAETATYTVAGIYESNEYDTPIYITRDITRGGGATSGGQSTGDLSVGSTNEYTLGRVVVDNRRAAGYLEAVTPLLPPGVVFELHDQGYEAATRAIWGVRETAVVLIAVCVIAGLVVLWSYAFLFVYRSTLSVRLLLVLGSGAWRTMLFLLTGSALVAAVSAAAGCVGGYLVSGKVIAAVFEAAKEQNVFDFRFSLLGLGAGGTFDPSPGVSTSVYVVIATVVFASAVLLCLLFGWRVIRNQNAHIRAAFTAKAAAQRKSDVPGAASWGKGVTSFPNTAAAARLATKDALTNEWYNLLPGVSPRYVARSILRGGWRSLVIPVLFLALLAFVLVFDNIRDSYSRQLEQVYDDVPVEMWFTDISATWRDGLRIGEGRFAEIEEEGEFVADMWRSRNARYMYLGIAMYADGSEPEYPPQDFFIGSSQYAIETFADQIDIRTRGLVFTNNYATAPEFAQTSAPSVEWKAGADGGIFKTFEPEGEPYILTAPCIVSREFFAKNELSLGDTIAVSAFYPSYTGGTYYWNFTIHLEIAGVYTSAINRETIILPEKADVIVTGVVPQNTEDGNYTSTSNMSNINNGHAGLSYHAGGFLLTNTERLSELKDLLEGSYDELGHGGLFRRWIIVDDKPLYNTLENLRRYVGYFDMIYPVMLAMIAGIAFIASNLLLKSRARELNTLRGLGASRGRVFCSFFFEPVVLTLPGLAVAAVYGALPGARVTLLALFFYAGVAAAVLHTYRNAVMASREEE
uniref:ABC3 transporter permease C-terminal domain-containing protein n=1 Tax=uncultured bacterium contig00045 TaxID=1181531 RepID=A0A806KLI5_9BACT|nr:hypothetical protein [uncultured bacterium contig00045]